MARERPCSEVWRAERHSLGFRYIHRAGDKLPRPQRKGDTIILYTVANVRTTYAARCAARKFNTFATPDAAISAMQRVADAHDVTITFDVILCVDDEGEDRRAVDVPGCRVSPACDYPWNDGWRGAR